MRVERKALLLLLLALAFALLLVAGCAPGEQDGEPQEREQQDEAAGLSLDVVQQWSESGHSRVVVSAAEEEGCQNCHDGLTFSETGGGFQPRIAGADETGTAGSEEATGAAEGEEERDWLVAIDCRACHTGAGVQIAEEGSVDGIPELETAEGGTGALCMACHNGWHPAGEGREGNLAAPHSSVQTDMLFGVNTLQVGESAETTRTDDQTGTGETTGTAGAEEAESPHTEVENTCVGCHVAGGDDANHLFRIENFEGCEREECHDEDMTDGGEAAEDFDGDGTTERFSNEIEGLMGDLEDAINQSAGSSSFASERGDIAFEGGGRVRADDPAYQAAYNYLYVQEDKSGGIHNPQFTVQLLQDSIAGLGGTQ